MSEKHVLVVGSGPGGYVAAIRAAQLGARVTVIEKGRLGGTCLNIGCIPTKCMLHSAELVAQIREQGSELGVKTGNVEVDFPQVIAHKNAVSNRLVNGINGLFRSNGIARAEGEARFTAARTLVVKKKDGSSEQMTGDAIILATGSVNVQPPIPGLKENPNCIDSIFVIVEQRGGAVQKVSYELIGEACKLAADLGEQVVAVLLGHRIADRADALIQYGASKVLVVEHPVLETYTTEPYVKAVEHIIRNYDPNVVLFGASSIGRDMAPRIAGRIHTGLTSDCTRLDVDVKKYQEYLRTSTSLALQPERIDALDTSDCYLKMTRPAFGGNVMATIVCRNYSPQMATVRPGVMEMPQRNASRTGEIVMVDAGLSMEDRNVEVLAVVENDRKAVDITEAKILVSGGRGVGGAEGYEPLRALAAELGGEVSSSRIGVDNGWIEKSRQVGQTGKTVHPNLYIACGISGAIQHLAGMEDSEFIIAINKDETCPMMKVADLGIVGDLKVIIPKLTEAIKAYKASQKF